MSQYYSKVVEQVAKALDARIATLEAQIEILKVQRKRQQPTIIIFKGPKKEGS
jgi:uncharacterized protein YciI